MTEVYKHQAVLTDSKNINRQQGVALLSVMLLLALMSTLIIYLIENQYIVARGVAQQRDIEQRILLQSMPESWATKILEADAFSSTTDHLQEAWNTEKPNLRTDEHVEFEITINDLQSRFNLNNLVDKDEHWYATFKHLLIILELDESIADTIVDWLDADSDISGINGAEDGEYSTKTPPYRTGNQAFKVVGELLQVKGIDLAVLDKLSPFIAVLPSTNSKININTASHEVILAIDRALSESDASSENDAASVIEERPETGYTLDQAIKLLAFAGISEESLRKCIDVKSDYFELQSLVAIRNKKVTLYSIINRPWASKKSTIIQRRLGI